MMGLVTRIRRTHLAAFLIGGVMGIMAEMAAGLMLYQGPGLLRATTLVLAMEAAAAGAGLLIATRVPREDVSRQLRRHLHLTLVSLGLAGILTSMWAYFGGLSVVRGGQAAALAILAALPLYLAGTVLGLVCRAGSRDAEEGTVAVGGPALLGAATGFLIYGLFLIPRLAPPVLVLLCMAAVSAAALLHGSEEARRAAGETSDGEEKPPGEAPESAEAQESTGAPESTEAPESTGAVETAEEWEEASGDPHAGVTLREPEESGESQTREDQASSITQILWNSET